MRERERRKKSEARKKSKNVGQLTLIQIVLESSFNPRSNFDSISFSFSLSLSFSFSSLLNKIHVSVHSECVAHSLLLPIGMCVLNFRSFLLRESDLSNVQRCRMIEQIYARVIQVSLTIFWTNTYIPNLRPNRDFLSLSLHFSLSHFFLSISLLISLVTRVLSSTNSRVSTREGEISSPSPPSLPTFIHKVFRFYNRHLQLFATHFLFTLSNSI